MRTVEVMLRSDHLEAVINYALEQCNSSGGDINPLAFGDNENAVGELPTVYNEDDLDAAYSAIKTTLESMLQAVKFAKGGSHTDLILLPLPANYNPIVAWEPIVRE